jgi:hypothetical protein
MMSLLASLEEKLFGRKQVARCARRFSCGRESRARFHKKENVSCCTDITCCFVLESHRPHGKSQQCHGLEARVNWEVGHDRG